MSQMHPKGLGRVWKLSCWRNGKEKCVCLIVDVQSGPKVYFMLNKLHAVCTPCIKLMSVVIKRW